VPRWVIATTLTVLAFAVAAVGVLALAIWGANAPCEDCAHPLHATGLETAAYYVLGLGGICGSFVLSAVLISGVARRRPAVVAALVLAVAGLLGGWFAFAETQLWRPGPDPEGQPISSVQAADR
jgi:hypothetical protein